MYIPASNWLFIAVYILAFLMAFIGALFFRQSILTSMVLLMALLPVLSIVLTCKSRNGVQVSAGSLPVSVEAGQGFKLTIMVENSTILPMLNCCLYIKYRNMFFEKDTVEKMVFAAPAKSRDCLELSFDTAVSGLISFEIDKLEITDFLHFVSFDTALGVHREVVCLPRRIECDIPPMRKLSMESEAVPGLTGEVTSEIRQFRGYLPGDRLKDIHWKQTARSGELTVKEYERMQEEFYVLLPILSGDERERTLELYYAAARYLISRNESFYTVLLPEGATGASLFPVSSEDELLESLYKLYRCRPVDTDVNELIVPQLSESLTDITVIRDGRIE